VNRTRWIATGVAALAVALGSSAALAAAGSSNPASDFLGDVANRLGISEDKLEGAIEDATIARIDAAVADGEITKEEGEALKERVRSGDFPALPPSFHGPGLGFGPPGHDRMFGPGLFPGADLLDTAAGYLGMDEAEVREALRDGKSLAELAKDEGKSVEGLEQALRDELRKDADRAVDDGVLTKESADRLVEKLSACVDELVENEGRLGFGRFGPPGPPRPPGPPGKGIVPGLFPGHDFMETAADYLGVDPGEVREALRDGKSLADLARAEGKSVAGLKKELRDAIRADADRAVEDGALTREQADRLANSLGSAVDDLVEGSLKDGFDFDFRGGGGSFEFHFRIRPEDGRDQPARPGYSSLEPELAPPRPL
jgi:polyhydroxyalkanoate synthesis regulator phasin